MEIPAASRSEKAALGQGYDTLKEEFVGQCVRGQVEFAGNQESRLSFDRSMAESSMSKELGFEAGMKARYFLFSGSAAAQFASESSSSEYSDVTIYNHTMTFKNAKLHLHDLEAGLSPEGRAARGTAGGNMVGEHWPLTCGDEFVSQITLGAKLMISVKIEFATREDKRSFGAQFSFKGPPLEVKASLKTASKRFGKRASLSVHAYQLGGDIRKLSAIFGGGTERAPILVASLENPDAVLDVLDAAVRYSAIDFPTQIDPNAPVNSFNGPAQLSYITSPWAELGLFAPPPIVTAGVNEARRLLSDAFEKHAQYQRRLNRILFGPVRLSPRQLMRFKTMQQAVTRNLSLIQEAALVAYSDFRLAAAKVAEVIPQLQDYTPEEFDIQPESFAQWWDMKDLPGTLIEDRRVIEQIAAQIIPEFNDFGSIEDQGLALQQRLATLKEVPALLGFPEWVRSPVWTVWADSGVERITLPDVSDGIKPALVLSHLRELSTVHNLVTDSLDGVERLGELRELTVTGPIETLMPLAGLKHLTKLTIWKNNRARHGDLTPLAGISSLREIFIDDGGVEDTSQLAGLALESVGLWSSTSLSVRPLADITSLRAISFKWGEPNGLVSDVTALGDHPKLGNLFFAAPRIVVKESDRPPSIWTRRDDSNVFGTESEGTGASTGTATLLGVGEGFTADGNIIPEPHIWISHATGQEQRTMLAAIGGSPDAEIGPGEWMGEGGSRGTWTATKGAT